MVLSDGMVHSLKIETNFNKIYQNYLVALKTVLGITCILSWGLWSMCSWCLRFFILPVGIFWNIPEYSKIFQNIWTSNIPPCLLADFFIKPVLYGNRVDPVQSLWRFPNLVWNGLIVLCLSEHAMHSFNLLLCNVQLHIICMYTKLVCLCRAIVERNLDL